jgi:DNA gyrase/topoisomerase IV subunit A
VAAGVNGVKLGVGDEVVGAEVVPDKGEVFVMASDGKAKRVPSSDIPTQGRYGRGVILWNLPKGVTLAGLATGKPNHVATVHLLELAPKSTRLDAAPVRKRAAVRGDSVVDVKAGDAVQAVVTGWEVENFVVLGEQKAPAKKTTTTKKPPAKKKPATKKTASKTKSAASKKATTRKTTSRKTTRKK